jgi:hypothetical protein
MKIARFVSALTTMAATGLLFGGSTTSHAAVNAMAGIAQNPAQSTCFTNSNGRITNTCAGTRRFCAATNVTSTGNKTVQVTALRPNGGVFQCHSVSTTKEGNVQSSTGNVVLNVVGVHTQFTVGTVNVPASGAAYTCCDLSQNATWDTMSITN